MNVQLSHHHLNLENLLLFESETAEQFQLFFGKSVLRFCQTCICWNLKNHPSGNVILLSYFRVYNHTAFKVCYVSLLWREYLLTVCFPVILGAGSAASEDCRGSPDLPRLCSKVSTLAVVKDQGAHRPYGHREHTWRQAQIPKSETFDGWTHHF